MDKKKKEALIEEANFQLKMLQNLKRWLRNTIILSSIALTLILFGANFHQTMKVMGIILMAIALPVSLLLGWTIKKGTANLDLLLRG